jgi:RNA-directed DNA polymerase
MLSNILMANFDRHVSQFCTARGVTYTRYADDLSFSAAVSQELQIVEKFVVDWCAKSESPSLTVNQKKTIRVTKREARRVTGLVLTNDRKVSLGRETKRRIRAGLHHFVTGKMAPEDISRLSGMLAYVNSVEPSFMRRLRRKYGSQAVRRCLHWNGSPS